VFRPFCYEKKNIFQCFFNLPPVLPGSVQGLPGPGGVVREVQEDDPQLRRVQRDGGEDVRGLVQVRT
jgi:hypothetical protein